MAKRSNFFKYLRVATFLHVGVLASVIIVSGCRSFFGKKAPDLDKPQEFLVDVNTVPMPNVGEISHKESVDAPINDAPTKDPEALAVVEKPKPKPKPKPEVKKEPDKTVKNDKPKDKPKAAPLVKNQKKQMSKEEIRQLLAKDNLFNGNYHRSTLDDNKIKDMLRMGATPSDRTMIPEGDLLYYEVIKRAFNKAWMQPSYEEVGSSVAKLEVRFQLDGSIAGVRLSQKSGHASMDDTVLQAANAVQRVDGLPSEFLRKYNDRPITLAFKVTPEG